MTPMPAATRRILHLLLALIGLLAAAALAHLSAAHGAGLIWQTVIGTTAYTAATAGAGRLLGAHPADAVIDSITELAGTIAAALTLAAAVISGIAALFTADTDTDPATTSTTPAKTA